MIRNLVQKMVPKQEVEVNTIKLKKNLDDERMLRKKVHVLRSIRKYDEALEIVNKFLEKHPDNERMLLEKAYNLYNLRRYDQALTIFDGILGKHPDDVSLLLKKANTLKSMSKYQESYDLYETIFAKYPDNSLAYANNYAELLLEEPKGDNHDFLDSKIKKTNNAIWVLVKCRLYYKQKNFQAAKQLLEKIPYENIDLQKELVWAHKLVYEFDKVVKLCTEMLNKYPKDVGLLLNRADAYTKQRKYDLAMEDIERACVVRNDDKTKRAKMITLSEANRYDEALYVWNTLHDKMEKRNLRAKARMDRIARRYDSCLDCYKQLLENNPHDVDGVMGHVFTYESTEQYDLAIEQIDKLLDDQGFVLNANRRRASILVKMERYVEARDELNRIIKKLDIEPDSTSNVQRKQDLVKLYNSTLEDIVALPESDVLEFKSTLRWSVKGECYDDRMEYDILKTICGFLNSYGGCLIVGYSDYDKKYIGLKKDYERLKKPNFDGLQLHLGDKINDMIGGRFSDLVRILPACHTENGHKFELARIHVNKSDRAAFLSKKHEFCVRQHGQTRSLDPRTAYSWIVRHDLQVS